MISVFFFAALITAKLLSSAFSAVYSSELDNLSGLHYEGEYFTITSHFSQCSSLVKL